MAEEVRLLRAARTWSGSSDGQFPCITYVTENS